MYLQALTDPIVQLVSLMVLAVAVRLAMPAGRKALVFAESLLFFLLLTALLLFHGIEPYSPFPASIDVLHSLFFGLAKTLWWAGGAMMLVSSVRLFLNFELKPREGRLIQDLLAGIIYVGAALSVVAYVFGVPVGTLIATSGIFAVILGLALQSTLSDVFSGLALNLGRAYAVGDWIVLDGGVQGRVVETTWRATHLLNGTNDLVIIPNSALAKAQLVNLSSPDESHGISVVVRLAPTRAPAVIEEMMRTVLLSSKTILRTPAPLILITDLDRRAIQIELTCRISDAAQVPAARNEIYDLVYRHSQAAGVTLAGPENEATVWPLADEQQQTIRAAPPTHILKTMSLFTTLTDAEEETLEATMVPRTFRKGETIIEQATRSPALMLVRSGVVVVERLDNGQTIELNRLSPGDCFGERGVLMGMDEPGTIRALTSVVVFEISAEQLAPLMQARPDLAEELGAILADRLEAETHIGAGDHPHGRHPASLSGRIRQLFQLQRRDGA